MIETKQDILEILNMPEEAFLRDVLPEVGRVREAQFGRRVLLSAMIGYTNVCKNQCLYCGMRAGNSDLKRFRVAQEFANRMLDKGVYVTGFSYPVVPMGKARVRTQISAGHTKEDLDFAVKCFGEVKKEMGI